MKKGSKMIATVLAILGVLGLTACGGEKNISVVVREAGSGTREAFDKVVNDGEHFLEEKNDQGNKVYNTTLTASIQSKTSAVLSTVEKDVNAIGYVSLGSVSNSVKVIQVEGVSPSTESVLSGAYQIQRPFVIMTNNQVELTPIAQDFMKYLQSSEIKEHAERAGCIFLEDGAKRTNEGEMAIPVIEFTKQEQLPTGGKIVLTGSTSMEKLITEAAKGYATLYGEAGENLFDVQLQSSSEGKKATKVDRKGNVIGLSSASVQEEGIRSFNVCLDAVAVIVNQNNTTVSNLTLKNLYDIFSGKITKFSEVSARSE